MNQPHAKPLPGPTDCDGLPCWELNSEFNRRFVTTICPRCETPIGCKRSKQVCYQCPKCRRAFLLHAFYARMLIHEGNTDVSIIERN